MEPVTEFTYLGSVQHSNGCCTMDILRRIGLASSTMWSLDNLWRQQKIQLETNWQYTRRASIPVLLYGADTCKLQTSSWRRLDAFHHRCQRHILQIKRYDHVSNQEVTVGQLSSIRDIICPNAWGFLDMWLGWIAASLLEMLLSVPMLPYWDTPSIGLEETRRRSRLTWLHQIGDGPQPPSAKNGTLQSDVDIPDEWGRRRQSILMMMMIHKLELVHVVVVVVSD